MTGLLVLVAVSVVATVALVRAIRRLDARAPVCPCDACGRMTSARDAHTHHHEHGCGIDHPSRQWCRCDPWRCPSCCPCSIEALLGRRERAS